MNFSFTNLFKGLFGDLSVKKLTEFVNYFYLLYLAAGAGVMIYGIVVLINGFILLGTGYISLGSAYIISVFLKKNYNRLSRNDYLEYFKLLAILMIAGLILIGFGFYNYLRIYT